MTRGVFAVSITHVAERSAITIELPRELEEVWQKIPEADRQNFAVAALRDAILDWRDASEEFASLTDEDLASIGRGLAEADAGLGTDGETYFANLRRRVGLTAEAN
jgi:predicted transcriptional regulator